MALEDDLQELIEKRREIDRALLERHAVDMAVLFTDIVGSTAYFEQRGDIEGLALVHRHNDLLFPVVKAHGGRVVKTIGDSIMAVFAKASEGVACAVALQETLAQETGTAAVERIRIRVGVHFGRVLKDGDDVFGDTVNTAARVASAADGDEVIVSQAAFDALPKSHSWLAAPKKALSAKGKSAPVPVVSIAWRPRDQEDARAVSPAAQELFILEIALISGGRGPSGLRVAAMDGEAERGTVKAYADVALAGADIDKLAEPFAVLGHDGGQAAYASSLAERGRALFERALPQRVRERLTETTRHTVRLHLEDTLVHVPWELCHDGTDYLGCRFAVGRMVAAKADAAVPPPSSSADQIVVLANCAGDLPDAEEEGRVVEKLFQQATPGRVILKSGRVTRAELLDVAGRARILHFAGHVTRAAEGGGGGIGFVVADGVVTAADFAAALKEQAPLLVFANACHASTAAKWRDTGAMKKLSDAAADGAGGSLAQALLLAGVRHTLAPLWSVPDTDALSFALRFYESALSGVPFGESARRARKALVTSHAAPLSFAGYVLYGDPRATLPASDAKLPQMVRTRSGDYPRVDADGKAQRTPLPATSPLQQALSDTQPTASIPRETLPAHAQRSTSNTSSTLSSSPPRLSAVTLGAVGGLLVGVAVVAFLVVTSRQTPQTPTPPTPPPAVIGKGASEAAPTAPATPPAIVHSGPVRVSVMPFKSTGTADPTLDYLKLGLTEVLVTAFADGADGNGIQLIERGQIDVDIAEVEFSQTKYVDPQTRAQLGKIAGAEVAVLGGWQLAGDSLRFTARFVDVETGEVLAAAKVDGFKDDVFSLQDKLADQAKQAMAPVKKRMRP